MNKIRTTHAGSLPRPAALASLHAKKFRGGEPVVVITATAAIIILLGVIIILLVT